MITSPFPRHLALRRYRNQKVLNSGVSKPLFLFLLLLLSTVPKTESLQHAHALSLGGWGRSSLRNISKLPSAIPPQCQDDVHISNNLFEDDSLQRSYSALATSPLFSATPSKLSRRRNITSGKRFHMHKIARSSQLNYKDYDDDLIGALEEKARLRSSLFTSVSNLARNKRLSKKQTFKSFDFDEKIEAAARDLRADDPGFATSKDDVNMASVQPPSKLLGFAKRNKQKSKNSVSSPTIVTNVHELRKAILDDGVELRDVELKYTVPPSLRLSTKSTDMTDDAPVSHSGVLKVPDEVQLMMMEEEERRNHDILKDVAEKMEPLAQPTSVGNDFFESEWQMIGNVMAEDEPEIANEAAKSIFSHEVLNLLHQRYHSRSTPFSRAANDTSKLALSIEGGGMRGAVSGGMAAAICCLGLCDAFDAIYGSSAGSIIGSYFVSRQLYLDVYTDVIPAGKTLFVRKGKIIGDIFRNLFNVAKGPLVERFRSPSNSDITTPPPTRVGGLNISFVLDSIMCPQNGLRPLDLESFSHNDEVQPLRIVSSAVEMDTGRLKTVCFGSKEGHFRDTFANYAINATESEYFADSQHLYPVIQSAEADKNGHRRGLWACLAASMTVPGAAGSPWQMNLPSSTSGDLTPHLCYDAFCYEPVPFRSAVEEGATHVLALRSRPAGFQPKTKPTLYERAVAPLYFRSHGVNTVAEFFERGGQQYLYAEDVLTLDEGLDSEGPIKIPPATVLYALPNIDEDVELLLEKKNRDSWREAHLLPITVAADVPELSTLSQDREDILAGMRSGFAAAFDVLAPVVGIKTFPGSLDGKRVAELVFSEINGSATDDSVLYNQFELPGEKLGKGGETEGRGSDSTVRSGSATPVGAVDSPLPTKGQKKRFFTWISPGALFRRNRQIDGKEHSTIQLPSSLQSGHISYPVKEAAFLLSALPGLKLGSLPMVAERLQNHLGNDF